MRLATNMIGLDTVYGHYKMIDENLKQISKIKNLLRERNRVCKANKK